jgi:cysteine-rich repeat protein
MKPIRHEATALGREVVVRGALVLVLLTSLGCGRLLYDARQDGAAGGDDGSSGGRDASRPDAASVDGSRLDGSSLVIDGAADGASDGAVTDAALDAAIDCGNGTVDVGEDCDDGARVDGDGCASTCVLEDQGPGGEDCITARRLSFAPIGGAVLADPQGTEPCDTFAGRLACNVSISLDAGTYFLHVEGSPDPVGPGDYSLRVELRP